MQKDDDALLPIAVAVADGTEVQWERQQQHNPTLSGRIGHLRLIHDIAEAYRSGSTSEDVDAPPSSEQQSTRDLGSEEPASTWGPLRVLSRLGSGGFGEVYRAHDPALQRDVALKLIHPGRDRDGTRFLREARRLARVRHDNVITVHGADRHDGRVGLWTDLLDGETLEERLGAHGAMGAEEATNVGIQLCRALAAVHAEGLIHQDVKTANVMRERSGRIVLLDFGAVTEGLPDGDDERDPPTGTPVFMAPERLRGGPATPASDLYSAGVLLYRLVTGANPVEAKSLGELRARHEREELTPLRDRRPDLPSGFVHVVETALAVDPNRRYRTAGEMERALQGWDRPRKQRRWIGPALLAGLGLAALAGWLWLSRPLQIDASLIRIRDGVEERLASGAAVAATDELLLEIRGNRRMHIVVLNQDSDGNGFVLFPLPELETRNPLTPTSSHRLPGGVQGVERRWGMTVAGGAETFFVVASASPIEGLDEALARVPRSRRGAVPVDAGLQREILRGFGGIVAAPAPHSESSGPLSSLMRSLEARAADAGDLRVWRMELRGPD